MVMVETVTVLLVSSQGLSFVEVPLDRPATFRVYTPALTVEGQERKSTLRIFLKVDDYTYIEQERTPGVCA